MYDDAAASERLIRAIVIHGCTRRRVPDLDSERVLRWPAIDGDVTGVFSTSGSEREFTLEERWYTDEETQAGADRNAATAD